MAVVVMVAVVRPLRWVRESARRIAAPQAVATPSHTKVCTARQPYPPVVASGNAVATGAVVVVVVVVVVVAGFPAVVLAWAATDVVAGDTAYFAHLFAAMREEVSELRNCTH